MISAKKNRVVIAMSGGVDSSVAAFLLKEQGYNVVGMSMQIWNLRECDLESFGTCCSPEDIHDARRVADQLKIPFYVINLEDKFKAEVIDNFANEYFNGRTPNPCIICNSKLKFHHLMRRAREIEADYVATGHYARIEKKDDGYHLLKGVDQTKDQSYFLFSVNQEQLKRIMFPVGNLKKSQIREIAKKEGIRTFEKKESQEICFVENNNYVKFLEKNYPEKPGKAGNFITKEGKILGKHKGIHAYTIGQRKGLGLSGGPFYVLKVDMESGNVILGDDSDLFSDEIIVKNLTWINKAPVKNKIENIGTKIRYRSNEAMSSVELKDNITAIVRFKEPQRGPTPGQAAVFYRDDEVLGGGYITNS